MAAAQLNLPTTPRPVAERPAPAEITLPDTRLFRWDAQRPFSRLFPGGFEHFESHFGVDGLARIGEQGLEICILIEKGALHLRDFLGAAKTLHARITVRSVTGPDQRDALLYLDFLAADLVDPKDGERIRGWEWTRQHQDACDAFRERTVIGPYRRATPAEIEAQQQALATALAMQRQHALQRAA